MEYEICPNCSTTELKNKHPVHLPKKVNGKYYGYYLRCRNNKPEDAEYKRVFIGY